MDRIHGIYDPVLGTRSRQRARADPGLAHLQLDLVQHRARRADHLDRRLHDRPHPAPVAPAAPRSASSSPTRSTTRRCPTARSWRASTRRRSRRSSAATGSSSGRRSANGATYIYGDRNRWVKMATLISPAGSSCSSSRPRSRRAWATSRASSWPRASRSPSSRSGRRACSSFATSGSRPRASRDGQGERLHDPPRGLPGREGDRREDDPGQRPALGRRLHVPPERLRAGAGRRHPRRGRQAALDRPGPDDRLGGRLPVHRDRRARP